MLVLGLSGEIVLRDTLTEETYCNSTLGLQVYTFDGPLCQEELWVLNNGTIVKDSGSVLHVEDVISVESINTTSVAGVKRNGTDYLYFLDEGFEFPLLDLNFSLPGISAWDPLTGTYWTVGDADVGRQLKFYKVETRNNYTTGFYTISTGEPPVNVFWNGTDVIGVVESNSTYFTVAFLKSSRKTYLGSAVDSVLLIDRQAHKVLLLPRQQNVTYLCIRECHNSPVATLSPTPSYHFTLPSIVISNTVSFNLYGVDITIDVPGRLVITEGTVVTVTISEGDFVTGDVITLFNYAELQGSFAGLELLSDSSCQHYEGELQYTTGAVSVVITVATNVCTAYAPRIKLL
jgi:hypothetical protein